MCRRGRTSDRRSLSTPISAVRLPSDISRYAVFGDEAARRASLVSGPFRARPLAFTAPPGPDELERLIRWAHAEGVSLIPRAGGTSMPGGNLGSHVVVEIGAGFEGIEPSDPGDEHIRVGAGVTAAEADGIARAHGRFLPFLPSSKRWARMGGMMATNAAGARTFGYGAARDWITGVEGLLADGTPFRVRAGEPVPPPFDRVLARLALLPRGDDRPLAGWPHVRKNSSGYALDRAAGSLSDPGEAAVQLLVGSEGTLAAVTRIEVRTAPLPEAVGLAMIPVASPDALADLAASAREAGAVACEFLARNLLEMTGLARDRFGGTVPYAVVLVETEGAPGPALEAAAALARSHTARAHQSVVTADPDQMEAVWSIRHAASPAIAREAGRGRISTQFIEDSVVPPDRLAEYLTGLDAILEGAGITGVVFGHAGDANVHANPLLEVARSDWRERALSVLRDVVALVASLGGTLSGEHGDGRIRAPFLSDIWPAALVHAFRDVKRELDPDGVLNPGVVLPLPDQDPFESFAPRPRSHPSVET